MPRASFRIRRKRRVTGGGAGSAVLSIRNRHLQDYGVVMAESRSGSDEFSERLRQAREYRGLTQGELAQKAGLQPSAVSHFETGVRKPSFDNLRLLADTLDVTT